MRYTRPYLITAVKNKKGQAIFELLIFLPFLLFFFIIMVNVGNSINSSINQQKATRRYFLYTIKNNSFIPLRNSLDFFSDEGYQVAGLYSFGFREKADNGGEKSFAPCYKIPTFFNPSGDNGEDCDSPEPGEQSSKYIRVFNFFGVCGETYFLNGDYYSTYRNLPGRAGILNTDKSCTFGN